MRNRQNGVTLIGWLLIIAIFIIFAMAAMRLVPVYLESLKVSSVLRSVEAEYDGNRPTVSALRKSIRTRFDIESINVIKHNDIKVEPAGNGNYKLKAKYEHKTPFLGNVGLIVYVDHQVEISR